MNCLITRNADNKIIGVSTPQGQKSELFETINSIPFLSDTETSASIFANAYTQATKELFDNANSDYKYASNEPKLYFSTGAGKAYTSLEEAILKDDPTTITIGFKNPQSGKLMRVASFDTKGTPKADFINDGIKTGLISASRILDTTTGKNLYVGKGNYQQTRQATARMAAFQSMVDHGEYISVNPDGTFEIDYNSNLIDVDGVPTALEDVPSAIKPTTPNKDTLLTEWFFRTRANKSKTKKTTNPKEERNLIKSMFGFLESLGFSVTSLEAYRQNYKTKYGKDPDIQAISDLTNKLVAFANGENTIENLSEEVAHIALEFYNDKNSIEDALAEVVLTPEYKEFADYYREKYAPFFEGVELETQVRKEILGKILGKHLQKGLTNENNEVSPTIFGRIKAAFDYVVNIIRKNFKPYHQTAIDSLNAKVYNAIANKQSEKFDQEVIPGGFFYSARPDSNKKIENELIKARKSLEDLYRVILEQRIPNQEELDKISSGIENSEILSSINSIVGLADTQSKILEKETQVSFSNNQPLSEKEQKRFHAMDGQISPAIKSIAANLTNTLEQLSDNDKRVARLLIQQIEDINKRMDKVAPQIDNSISSVVQEELDVALEETPALTDVEKQTIKDQVDAVQKDYNLLQKNFTMISQSSNILLQLLGNVVAKMNSKVVNTFRNKATTILEKIEKEGLESEQGKIIEKVNGKKTGYYLSMYNWAEFFKDRDEKRAEVVARLTGKPLEEVKKQIKSINFTKVLGKDYNQFRTEMAQWEREAWKENRFNEKYYADREKRFDQLNVSKETQEYLSNINSSVYNVTKKYQNPDGTIDKSKITESDKIEIQNFRQRKSVAKSSYNNFGELREGLKRVKVSDLTPDQLANWKKLLGITGKVETRDGNLVNNLFDNVKGEVTILEDGYTIDSLPYESRRSLDLNNMELLFRQELSSSKTVKDSFITKVRELQSNPDAALDWVLSNATISFTDVLFDNIDNNESYDVVAQQYINDITDPLIATNKQNLLDSYKRLQQQKKDLLKQHRRVGNPIEVDAYNMDEKVMDQIRVLEQDIETTRKALALPQEYLKEAGDRLTTIELSEDFYNKLQSSGKTAYEFSLDHMTANNKLTAETFSSQVWESLLGAKTRLRPSFQTFIAEMIDDGVINNNMTAQQKHEILRDEFAKRRVSQYFKRYEPKGYQQVMDALRSGDILLEDLFDENKLPSLQQSYEGLKYIQITPDYTWTEDLGAEDYSNQEYNTETPYYLQPKSKYINDEFFTTFGINKQAWLNNPTTDLYELSPTQNQKAFELLRLLTSLRDDTNDNYDQIATANKFRMVQISTRGVEKIRSLSSKAGLKEAIQDIFVARKDEKLFGEMLDETIESGDNVNIVPKMFQAELDGGPETLTENIILAEMTNYKQSLLYKARKESEPKVKAILWKIKHQQYLASGGKVLKNKITRTGEESNIYKFAKEYIDRKLYGIQQTRNFETEIFGQTVNLTKVATQFQAYSSFLNLAYNPLVALTSYTTGVLNLATNRITGDVYHKSSGRFALAEATRLMAKHFQESGKLNKDNPLSVMYDYFGVEDITERLENSKQGRAIRLMSKSKYGLDQLANKPVTSQALIASLKDTRFYNGKWLTFNEFKAVSLRNNLNPAEIEATWKAIEKDSLYENLNFDKKSQIGINEKFVSKYTSNEEANLAWDKAFPKVARRVKLLIQQVDSVLTDDDRVAAQSDVILNFGMQHRGWQLINLQLGFKKRGLNFAKGIYEEGQYRTLGNFLKKAVLSYKNPADIKKYYDNLAPDQKKNLRKSIVQSSALILLLLMGEAILAADDDDDTEFENLAQLIYLRTVSEFNSSTIFGTPGSIIDTAQNPIPAMTLLKSFDPVDLVTKFGQEDEDGNSKFWKQLTGKSLIWNRRYKTFSDLQAQVDAFRFYNPETLWNLGPDRKN